MLLRRQASYFLLIATVLISPTIGEASIKQTIGKFQDVAGGIDDVKLALDKYNGGIWDSFRVANILYDAHSKAEVARKHLVDSDPFSEADSMEIMNAYNDIYPRLLDTLKTGAEKAPEFKKAGVGYIARGMISNLHNEKNSFEDEMKTKLSPSDYRAVQPSAEEIDKEFKNTIHAFEN